MSNKRRNPQAFLLLVGQPWAMRRDTFLQAMRLLDTVSVKDFQIAASEWDDDEDQATAQAEALPSGPVAVVNLTGPITRYDTCMSSMNGYSTVESFMADLTKAANDPAVKAILLNVNSPGGNVDGISEAAAMVRYIDQNVKPVLAYVAGQACSAAYWIGSQARTIIQADTAEVGSIGCYCAFEDDTRAAKAAGIDRYTIVSSQSPNKVPDPSTDEGKALYQKSVDGIADLFINAVALGRKTTAKAVADTFGQGDTFYGADAVAKGMSDKVGFFTDAMDAALSAANEASAVRGNQMAGVFGSVHTDEVAALGSTDKNIVAEKEGVIMTLEELKAQHPDIYKAAFEAGRVEGASAERSRLLAIDDLGDMVHQEIVKEAKASGKTAAETALAIVMADKQKAANLASAVHKDAQAVPVVSEAEAPVGTDSVEAEVQKTMAAFKKSKEARL